MIHIPPELIAAIHQHVESGRHVNAMQLREKYRESKNHEGLHGTYLMSRMPATYAAITKVLQELPTDSGIQSVLDIGSGPGTGLWAAQNVLSKLTSYTGIEGDPTFKRLAEQLSIGSTVSSIDWIVGRYPNDLPNIKADLVLISYTVGENSSEVVLKTLNHLWQQNVTEWLIVIEPGTPKGFRSIMEIRNFVIQSGGHIYAPCSGNHPCPMAGDDWCHFSVRLNRSLLQKQVKQATLPYEDEKFSYLIVRKHPLEKEHGQGRVIKKPMIRSGHIALDVCSAEGYNRITVSKSEKETYHRAKKTEWGDSF
jgi:ribosomal protein RSM22 (predicted rRNA methylase)